VFVRRYGPITDGTVHYALSTDGSVLRAPARKVSGKATPYMKIYRTHLDDDGGRLPGQRG